MGERIYCHPQTDCFVLSELFSVARHAGRSKPGSKPIQLYVRLSLRPLGRQYIYIYIYIYIYGLSYIYIYICIREAMVIFQQSSPCSPQLFCKCWRDLISLVKTVINSKYVVRIWIFLSKFFTHPPTESLTSILMFFSSLMVNQYSWCV